MRSRAVVLVTLLTLDLAACGGEIAPKGRATRAAARARAEPVRSASPRQYGIPCDCSVPRNANRGAVQCICVVSDRSTDRWTCFDIGCDER